MMASLDVTMGNGRFVVAAFAFYRLPEFAKYTLAHNIAAWLMEGGQ